jgi:hypothetical protein
LLKDKVLEHVPYKRGIVCLEIPLEGAEVHWALAEELEDLFRVFVKSFSDLFERVCDFRRFLFALFFFDLALDNSVLANFFCDVEVLFLFFFVLDFFLNLNILILVFLFQLFLFLFWLYSITNVDFRLPLFFKFFHLLRLIFCFLVFLQLLREGVWLLAQSSLQARL